MKTTHPEYSFMIVYNRLWNTMALKGVTQYKLITNGISHSTLSRLKKNQTVNTDTLDKLCIILKCNIEDIVEYIEE
jgi:DNA-binding Xre family transcriptional regulator